MAPWHLKRHAPPQKPGLDVGAAVRAKESKKRLASKQRNKPYVGKSHLETQDNVPVPPNRDARNAAVVARRLESLKKKRDAEKQQ